MLRNQAKILIIGLLIIFNGICSAGVFPSAPLTPRWDTNKGILSRFYSTTPITEPEFFNSFGKVLGLKDSDSKIELFYEKASPSGLHKRYHQTYKGLIVDGAELLLNLDKQGNVISVFNNLYPLSDFDIAPVISLAQSEIIATAVISMNALRGAVTSDLVIALIEDEPRLVYRWRIPANEPLGDWEILVDAKTGEVVSQKDWRIFWVDGVGSVFIPDPKTAIECDTLHDWNDANWAIPQACYTVVDLLELNNAVGGVYVLSGRYVNTNPTANRATSTTPVFMYYRQDDRFEEVNVYYHIDTYQRYIQSLGFDNILNSSQSCNVNGTTQDNSWFSPMTGTITYGSGGVDDGEDADVIVHEYGHAMQHDINPYISGGHLGAMGEGFGDYIAGSYSLNINPDFHPNWVFTWDGHNEFWAGRILNAPYHYPENAGGEIHDAGQLWSAGLIDVWYDVPNVEIWDKIILEHHFYLGNGATMEDAANAILLADININNTAYRDIIIENFLERGFLNPAYLFPNIEHNPLSDSEDTTQVQFPVLARITSAQPLDTLSLLLYWGTEGIINDTLLLQNTAEDTFSAMIPGPFNHQTINYFLTVSDIYGGMSASPSGAPANMYSFYVGPDTIPPVITVLDTLPNTVFPYDDGAVTIVAQDNLGLESVQLFYHPEGAPYQSINMIAVNGDTFSAVVTWYNLQLNSRFYYYFKVQDSSQNQNISESAEYSFQVVSNALFDDFENGLDNWVSDDNWNVQTTHIHSPICAMRDRQGSGSVTTENAILTLGQSWITTGLDYLELQYWTQYFFLPQNDTGYVEVQDGLDWITIDTLVGAIPEWELRSINLSEFLSAGYLTLRFRTHLNTNPGASTLGWYLDDIILRTEPMVGFAEPSFIALSKRFEITSISPNPGNNEFKVTYYLPCEGVIEIELFNILGQSYSVLEKGFFAGGVHNISWRTDLPSGIYFLKFSYGEESRMSKLVILK